MPGVWHGSDIGQINLFREPQCLTNSDREFMTYLPTNDEFVS
jgi:hypothetical protein